MEKKAGDKEPKIPLAKQAVFRVGLALFIVIVLFAIAMQLAIPDSFGEYGRFRGDSIAENVSQDAIFASGNEACATCHSGVSQVVSSANHGQMDCQTCHGPAAAHTKNPGSVQPKVEQPTELCIGCHAETQGRLELATVKPELHSGGLDCLKCHNPHEPWAKIRG